MRTFLVVLLGVAAAMLIVSLLSGGRSVSLGGARSLFFNKKLLWLLVVGALGITLLGFEGFRELFETGSFLAQKSRAASTEWLREQRQPKPKEEPRAAANKAESDWRLHRTYEVHLKPGEASPNLQVQAEVGGSVRYATWAFAPESGCAAVLFNGVSGGIGCRDNPVEPGDDTQVNRIRFVAKDKPVNVTVWIYTQ